MIDPAGTVLARIEPTSGFDPETPLWAILEGRINGCTILAPRKILEDAGGFHRGLPTTQDYELWFRLARRRRLVAVPGALVSHRVHPGHGSRTPRHAEEAGLLWGEMLRSLTQEEIRRHAPSETAFIARAAEFLGRTGYSAARAGISRMMKARLRAVPLTLLWAGTGSRGPALALGALTDVGLDTVQCLIADMCVDATASLSLREAAPPGALLVRLRSDADLTDIFRALRAFGMGRVVMLADAGTRIDQGSIRNGLEMIEAGRADVWLSGDPPTPASDHRDCLPAAFRGALLARDAVEAALERCDALGCGDAAVVVGLVSRLAHPPSVSHVALAPPQVSAPASVAVSAPASVAVSVPASVAVSMQQTLPVASPQSDIAISNLHGSIISRARRLYRAVPGLRRLLGPLIGWVFRVLGFLDTPPKPDTDVPMAGAESETQHGPDGGPESQDEQQQQPVSPALVPSASVLIPPPSPTRLLLLNVPGDEALHYAEALSLHLRRHDQQPIVARIEHDRRLCIFDTTPTSEALVFTLPDGLLSAVAHLRSEGVVRVDVLHALGLEARVSALLEELAIPYDVTLLDYQMDAAESELRGPIAHIVGSGAAGETDNVPLPQRPALPSLVRGAARRLACSRDFASRLEQMMPGIGAKPVLPPEPDKPHAFRVTPPAAIASDEPLRVLLLGGLRPDRGRDVVLAAAAEAAQGDLPLQFHVLGAGPPVRPEDQRRAPLSLYGPFARADLGSLIAVIRPHLAWFPGEHPEAFDFSLSAAMLMGLPILARAVGAYPERLAGREFTWLMTAPQNGPASRWIAKLLALREAALRAPAESPEPVHLPQLDTHFYSKAYLTL